MNSKMLEILVCPLCKGELTYDKNAQELICEKDKLAYPIRDGIPLMWVEDARNLSAEPVVES